MVTSVNRNLERALNSVRLAGSGLLTMAILLPLGWASYGAVEGHRLLRWDDVSYVSANPFVQAASLDNLWHILTGFTLGNWHPLTWASYLLNYLTGTADVAGLKFTNLAIHVLASFMAGIVAGRIVTLTLPDGDGGARRVARYTALLTAVLFCIHPQHVESVTWVAERKDVLCGLFYFATLAVYLGKGQGARGRVGLPVVLLALLAMLSKPMAVSLPIVLVVADLLLPGRTGAVRLHTIAQLVAGKWLIFFCSAAVVAITLLGQSPQGLDGHGWADRLVVSLQALGFYVRQFFLPLEFVPFHPFSAFLPPQQSLLLLGTGVLLAPLLAWLPVVPAVGRRFVLAGFLFFVVTLLPVLGIVKVGEQAFADRYAYIPTLPFYVLAAWLPARFLARGGVAGRSVVAVVMLAVAAGLVHKTRSVLPVWASDEALWKRVVHAYPAQSALAHSNLGNVFFEQENHAEALAQYDIAISLHPDGLRARYNRALVLEKLGRSAELADALMEMVRRNPDSPIAWAWYGEFALRSGRIAEAEDLFKIALGIDARTDAALFGLARIRLAAGDRAGGTGLLRRIDPHSVYHAPAQRIMHGR